MGEEIAGACPPGPDRDRFRRALTHLGESEMVRTGPVEMEMMRRPAEPPPTGLPPVPATPGLRRLSILEQRLRREGIGQGAAAETARRRVVSQAITAAATEAKSEKELEDHLRRLRAAGVESGAQQVFRHLGQELADWAMPKDIVSDTADLGPANEVRAMNKIVSLPEDPIEVARRYRHLVSAATEQFNEGNLGRAVQMFDLATQLAAEKKIDAGFMEPILKKGHEALDPARLRQYMDKPDRHAQLQSVMAFFDAGLGPAALLDQLETEDRRDKRRLLLDLLVVHGEKGRAPRPGAAPGVARDAGQRLRPPQLDLPPAPRPPPRRRGGRGRDRRGRAPRRPRQPGLPRRRRPSSTSGRPTTRAWRRRSCRCSAPGRRSSSARTWTTPRARRASPPSTASPPPSPSRAGPRAGAPSWTTPCRAAPSSATRPRASPSWARTTCRTPPRSSRR